MYPNKNWSAYELVIKAAGEHRAVDVGSDGFLVMLGLVDARGLLTDIGRQYFRDKFIRADFESSLAIAKGALLRLKPVLAICQDLYGVPAASKERARLILCFHELHEGLTERNLGTLLSVMAQFGIISYYKGVIQVNEPPMQQDEVPSSVFISRQTPYLNTIWLKRILSESDGFVLWFDKHFLPAAFEYIWEAADGNRINEVRILSLKLDGNSGKRAQRQYRDLAAELANLGIVLDWRFIDSSEVKATHDRWVIAKSKAWNVPDVGTILSGNHSEISRSHHAEELRFLFGEYWTKAAAAFTV